MNDLKFAVRQLIKNRGLTGGVVFTLALAIGSNTVHPKYSTHPVRSFVEPLLERIGNLPGVGGLLHSGAPGGQSGSYGGIEVRVIGGAAASHFYTRLSA